MTHRRQLCFAYLLAALLLICAGYILPGLLPGDFVTAAYSGSPVTLDAEGEQIEQARHARPYQGFGRYLADVFTLKWGYSIAFGTSVAVLIFKAFPWTLLLMGSAHVVSMTAGFVIGVEAAWRRGRAAERTVTGSMAVMQGIPEIATGVVLLVVFSYNLGWFPTEGGVTAFADHDVWRRVSDIAHHLALPFLTLFLAYFPGDFLLARSGMVLVLGRQYLETARAKGLPPVRIRYAHAARNALLPMATRFGLRIAFMVTGVLVVETIFAYPGLGTLLFNAVALRDVPLVQGIVLFSSLVVLGINWGLDALYGLIDPRVNHAS